MTDGVVFNENPAVWHEVFSGAFEAIHSILVQHLQAVACSFSVKNGNLKAVDLVSNQLFMGDGSESTQIYIEKILPGRGSVNHQEHMVTEIPHVFRVQVKNKQFLGEYLFEDFAFTQSLSRDFVILEKSRKWCGRKLLCFLALVRRRVPRIRITFGDEAVSYHHKNSPFANIKRVHKNTCGFKALNASDDLFLLVGSRSIFRFLRSWFRSTVHLTVKRASLKDRGSFETILNVPVSI